MQWTDRIRQVKIILVIAAVIIAVASLLVSHFLVRDLSVEERHRMEVWAQALHALNEADETTDLSLVLSVMEGNNTIPVIVVNSEGGIDDYRNIEDSTQLKNYVKSMIKAGDTIRIGQQLVCYDESIMLKRLSAWPYVQLGIVLIFVVVAIFALLSSKRAEQNKVWVGLSKETAHQLGTPVSSLMAWVEMLKEQYPEDDLLPEMDKDVKRLQLIADRFSKIGSLPEPVDASMNEVLEHVIDYMDRRTSSHVQMTRHLPDHEVIVKMNASSPVRVSRKKILPTCLRQDSPPRREGGDWDCRWQNVLLRSIIKAVSLSSSQRLAKVRPSVLRCLKAVSLYYFDALFFT